MILKDQILCWIRHKKFLSASNKEKSSTYDIIRWKAIVSKKFRQIWQDFRADLASLETSSHFDACVALPYLYNLIGKHISLYYGIFLYNMIILINILMGVFANNLRFREKRGKRDGVRCQNAEKSHIIRVRPILVGSWHITVADLVDFW